MSPYPVLVERLHLPLLNTTLSNKYIQRRITKILAIRLFGAADRIRTCGLSGRSRTIYPAELQPHMYENRRWDEIHRIKL